LIAGVVPSTLRGKADSVRLLSHWLYVRRLAIIDAASTPPYIIKMDDSLQKVKFAVLLRTARVAIGWNQQEFADLLGVAKSSITRMETVEMAMPSIFAMRAMQLFRENGLEFDIFSADSTSVIITEKALQIAKSRLEDQTLRRSDMIPKKNKKISKKSVDAD